MSISRTATIIAAVALLFTAGPPAVAESAIAAPAGVSLSFGQVFAGVLPGSVRVSVTGFRTTAGATYAGSASRGSAARFTVVARPDSNGARAWSVMLPVSATLSSGKAEMTVDGFEYSWDAAGVGGDPNSRTLTVGATLHVGARQPSSDYAGSFALTVVYN
jgi:hypothetical protein